MFHTVQKLSIVIGIGWAAMGGGTARAADDPVAVITKVTDDVTEAGREFGKACGRSLGDQSAEKLADVRARFVDCLLLLDNLRDEPADLEVDDVAEGRALKAEFAAWLKAQTDYMQVGGLGFIRIAEDKKLSAEDRYKKLMDHAQAQAASEKVMGERLTAAFKAYQNRKGAK